MTEQDPQATIVTDRGKDRRRAQRVTIAMPVEISGKGDVHAFSLLTSTVTVSTNGCLVILGVPVVRSQELVIARPDTMQKTLGTVAYIGQDNSKSHEVGIEFLEPSPKFWGINFPPDNWDPSERKLPSRETPQPLRPGRLR